MERALIVRKEWLDKILDGGKVWEMRSTHTWIRGRIGLIEAGTGMIVGEVALIGCGDPITQEDAESHFKAHQVEDLTLLKKWRFPWFLEDAKRYDKPIPYDHPKGAVIWVKL